VYARGTPTFHRGIVNETFDELEPDSRSRSVRTSCLRDNEAIVIDFDDDGFAGCHYTLAKDGSPSSFLLVLSSCFPRAFPAILEIDGYISNLVSAIMITRGEREIFYN